MFKILVLPYCAFLKLSYGNSLSRTEEDADVSFLNLNISSWLFCHDEFGYIEQVRFAIAIAIASCLYVAMVIGTHLYCEGDMNHLCFIMVLCLYCESALSWHHHLFSFGFACAMCVLILMWTWTNICTYTCGFLSDQSPPKKSKSQTTLDCTIWNLLC